MENKLVPIEHGGQRVITTELLAEVYKTSPKNIQMNFANQRKNFKEGVHYILLQGEELRAFKDCPNNIGLVGKNAPALYLWTERGANRHCKILDTPKAWEQFDNLEETYFAVKERRESISSPKLAMDLLRIQSAAMLELDDRVTDLEDKVDNRMTLDYRQQRNVQKAVADRVRERTVAVLPPMEIDLRRKFFFAALHHDLKDRFGVPSYKDIRTSDYTTAMNFVESWVEPADIRNCTH